MGFVYFSIPIISGYFIMEAAMDRARSNLKDLPPTASSPSQQTIQNSQKSKLASLLDKSNPEKQQKSS